VSVQRSGVEEASLAAVLAPSESREADLRRGFLLEVLTVAWNVVEGIIACVAGMLAGSVALVGFGIDSFIETTSGVVVGWRLREEQLGRSADHVERIEKRAARIAGGLLLLLAAYLLLDAASRLLGYGDRPRESFAGLILTGVSLVVMPILGRAKLKTARALGSGALRADAYETITCAWLSLTTLVGLILNATLGWWWADPLAALVLVPLLVREGLEGWRGDHCHC
jgi:divalent metal cation (Fe/Co/Zn/Cd) transporter